MAYYLIADNKRRMPSSAYLQAEMTEAMGAQNMYPAGDPLIALGVYRGWLRGGSLVNMASASTFLIDGFLYLAYVQDGTRSMG